MSCTALAQSRGARRLCHSCRDRKARFRFRGVVKADRDHTLCFECFRSERDRRRAQLLAEVARRQPLRAPLSGPRTLTAREIEHRQQMLTHLEGRADRAGLTFNFESRCSA
jgi:hypothetical protein